MAQIKQFKDNPPTINFIILCDCGNYLRIDDFNSRLNLFVCGKCGDSDYSLISLLKYNELQNQAKQRDKEERKQVKQKKQSKLSIPSKTKLSEPKIKEYPKEKKTIFERWVDNWLRKGKGKRRVKGNRIQQENESWKNVETRISRE